MCYTLIDMHEITPSHSSSYCFHDVMVDIEHLKKLSEKNLRSYSAREKMQEKEDEEQVCKEYLTII